jgi:predicted Zn-dependent protease
MPMSAIEPPDIHYLSAALGWLGLGKPDEAELELVSISAGQQNHPDVLEARWMICAEQKRWKECLRLARSLREQEPERPTGWLHQAYALRRVPEGGLEQAWEALLPAFEKFPKEPIIPYNLSCYACQMRQLDAARLWLKRALALDGENNVKPMALADPDLEPLWKEIPGM